MDDSVAGLRQIERDLHDGAQAQTVAVAMKLGLAKVKLGAGADGKENPDLERAWNWSTPRSARRPSPSSVNWRTVSTRQCLTKAWSRRWGPSRKDDYQWLRDVR